MPAIYEVRQAGLRKGAKQLLADISFTLSAGEFVAILGPNGAGKSTLLKLLSGQEAPTQGQVQLSGQDATTISRQTLARQVALVEPTLDLPFALRAEELVMMGRAPHTQHWFESEEDLHQTNQALRTMDCESLRHRDFRTLSNGEKQRVLAASALAQQPCVLLLDEPAAFLDLAHQRDLFATLHQLAAQGYLIVAVTHDWNLAAAWASRILLLKDGLLAADGTPHQLANPELLSQVFGLPVTVLNEPGQPPFLRHAQ
jgi:iron complex transport system ATP-binding protein